MGASFDWRTYDAEHADDVRMQFRQDAEQDRWENGHSYSGSIGMANDIDIPTPMRLRHDMVALRRRLTDDIARMRTSESKLDKGWAADLQVDLDALADPDAQGVFPSKRAAETFVVQTAKKWEAAIGVRFREDDAVRWFVGAWCSS